MYLEHKAIMSYPCKAVIAANLRVKFDAGTGEIEVAGAEAGIGITGIRGLAIGDMVSVIPHNAPGTFLMTAGAAIAKGAAVYGVATNGKIDDAISGPIVGKAMEAAGGADELIEVLLAPSGLG